MELYTKKITRRTSYNTIWRRTIMYSNSNDVYHNNIIIRWCFISGYALAFIAFNGSFAMRKCNKCQTVERCFLSTLSRETKGTSCEVYSITVKIAFLKIQFIMNYFIYTNIMIYREAILVNELVAAWHLMLIGQWLSGCTWHSLLHFRCCLAVDVLFFFENPKQEKKWRDAIFDVESLSIEDFRVLICK